MAFGNRLQGWRDRLALWRAGKRPVAKGFARMMEPRSIGLYLRGKQMVAGNFTAGKPRARFSAPR